jgi:dTDP-4-dehydrorhamnose reductase
MEARGFHRVDLDLSHPASIQDRLAGVPFDVLINCAAYTHVDAAEDDAATACAVNAYAVQELATICDRTGALFLHVSTDYVFDGESNRPYRTDDAPAPLNVYGASKLAGEAMARRACPDGALIVRTSSLFGLAGTRPGSGGNFVETMLRLGTERGTLRVVADNMMAPTFSADLAGALLDLVRIRPGAGIYHLTNEGQTSWHGLAVAALDLARVNAEITPVTMAEYPTPARRPRFSVLDTGKATALIGKMPAWQDALERYMALRSA